MKGRLRARLSLIAAAFGAVAAVYLLVVRPWHLRWGASAEVVSRPLAGDELIPSPRMQSTRAITIAASAERVWPWLVQLGTGRGGWYSYDFLENLVGLRIHTVNRIVPELQHLRVGDIIPAAPPPYLGFRVLSIEPPHVLVTSATVDLITGLTLDPEGPPAGRRLDSSYTFVLQPVDESRCQLIARFRSAYAPGLVNDLLVRCALEPVHFVMERGMLQGIKRRAETATEDLAA